MESLHGLNNLYNSKSKADNLEFNRHLLNIYITSAGYKY